MGSSDYRKMPRIRIMKVIFTESRFAQNIQLALDQGPKIVVCRSLGH